MKELKSGKTILQEYLSKAHPDYLSEGKLSQKDIEFLARFCIERQDGDKPNDVLKEKKMDSTHDKYFGKSKDSRTYPGIVRDEIQYIYTRFHEKQKKYKKAFGEVPESGQHTEKSWHPFANFMNWWIEGMNSQGKLHCYYCEIDEQTVKDAFDQGKISSKKRSFSGNLQIDRKVPPTEESSTEDSDGGYNHDNCVFACVLCNNAKSDMIPADVFKSHFGKTVNAYWKSLIK